MSNIIAATDAAAERHVILDLDVDGSIRLRNAPDSEALTLSVSGALASREVLNHGLSSEQFRHWFTRAVLPLVDATCSGRKFTDDELAAFRASTRRLTGRSFGEGRP